MPEGLVEADSIAGLETVKWVPMDLLSSTSIAAAIGEVEPEQVYHLAGQASVRDSFADPETTWGVNATGTLRLLQALQTRNGESSPRRFLLISSAEVYGEVSPAAQPTPEETPIAPITPYGASKAAAETVALQMGRAGGIQVVIARSFNHIGPGQDERFVLASIARQLARIKRSAGDPVIKVGNLAVDRDFLDVRDVAQAYLRLMDSGEPLQVYNVCSGAALSLSDVVQRLVDLSESGARVEVDSTRFRPADIPLLVGDGSRLRQLGWAPHFNLDSTLRDLLIEAESRA
jgi:GDP-4-dehydro-6-deoxy-D-mannose reductase